MVRTSSWMGALVLVLLSAGSANARATAEGNLKKGFIQCGVNTGLAGFSQPAGDTYLRALAVGLLNTFRERRRTSYVILPQALRIAIPPLVNTFIGFFKDTSLVVIIGLFDFLTTIKVSLAEPAWTGFGVEAYLFAALGYFLFCYPMSRYSQGLNGIPRPAEGFTCLGRIETRVGGTTIGS